MAGTKVVPGQNALLKRMLKAETQFVDAQRKAQQLPKSAVDSNSPAAMTAAQGLVRASDAFDYAFCDYSGAQIRSGSGPMEPAVPGFSYSAELAVGDAVTTPPNGDGYGVLYPDGTWYGPATPAQIIKAAGAPLPTASPPKPAQKPAPEPAGNPALIAKLSRLDP
jgi:hypothetical protein